MKKPRHQRVAPPILEHGRLIVIHARISSNKQQMDRQLLTLRETATRALGGNVVAEVCEQVSASANDNEQRPDLQRIFELARAGQFNTLLVDDVDRLGRIPSELHATRRLLTELGVSIYFARLGLETLTPDGRKNVGAGHLFAGKAEMAEDEIDSLRHRTVGGILAARAKINPADPGAVPWGRARCPDGARLTDADLLRAIRTGQTSAGRPFEKAKPYRKVLKLLLKKNTRRAVMTLTGTARATVDKLARILIETSAESLTWLTE